MSQALIKRLGEAFAQSAGQRDVISLIVYTPFGIVRGELTQGKWQAAAQNLTAGDGMIELQRVVVEHYSNHIPTGNYAALFISLKEISGFSVIKEL
jgi:hypothetical protein